MKRGPIIFLAVGLILLAAALVAVYIWQLGQKAAPAATSRPTVTPTPMTTGVTITDRSNLYTITFPANWEITTNEGKKGVQVSRITAQSPDFRVRTDESADGPFIPQYYESGASFTAHAIPGDAAEVMQRPGIASRPIIIDNYSGSFRAQKEISTLQGENVDAMVHINGINYTFTMAYNSDTYPQGREVFQQILNSFHVL